jgi:hypothetical protein
MYNGETDHIPEEEQIVLFVGIEREPRGVHSAPEAPIHGKFVFWPGRLLLLSVPKFPVSVK